MKKLTYLALALALAAPLGANAERLNVENIQKVALPEGVTCDIPTISPDGSYVIVGHMGLGELNKVDLSTGEITLISENGDADALVISPDGQNIVFRSVTFDKNKLRQTALKSVRIDNLEERQLVNPSRHLNAGFAVSNDGVTAVENGRTKKLAIAGRTAKALPMASINYGDLEVTVNGKTSVINPQGDGSYLWPSVSPDGTKVAYVLSGYGAFVCDLDGSNPRSIGFLHAPRWYGNDMVVGMEDYDDGYVITASDIVVTDLDGNRQKLTDGSVKAMYPSVSTDGMKIAFATPEGELYIINVK